MKRLSWQHVRTLINICSHRYHIQVRCAQGMELYFIYSHLLCKVPFCPTTYVQLDARVLIIQTDSTSDLSSCANSRLIQRFRFRAFFICICIAGMDESLSLPALVGKGMTQKPYIGINRGIDFVLRLGHLSTLNIFIYIILQVLETTHN